MPGCKIYANKLKEQELHIGTKQLNHTATYTEHTHRDIPHLQ